MTYWVGKIFWAFANPHAIVMLLLAAGLFALWKRRRRAGAALCAASLGSLWFFSSGACVWLLGLPLESPYTPERAAEDYPRADAIVLLGGGVADWNHDSFVYPDCNAACDRVWQAARLFRAGKAPVVVTSGTNDFAATRSLLNLAGVPDSAIVCETKSRNTAENFQYTAELLAPRGGANPRILVVTSAWHMRRAMLIASRTGVEAIPAPCDFAASPDWEVAKRDGVFDTLVFAISPSVDKFSKSCFLMKEWIGWIQKKISG